MLARAGGKGEGGKIAQETSQAKVGGGQAVIGKGWNHTWKRCKTIIIGGAGNNPRSDMLLGSKL